MPRTEVSAYPWQSAVVFAAELDADGGVVRANAPLQAAFGPDLEGLAFAELLAGEQRAAFGRRLAGLGGEWESASFSFDDVRGGAAKDRCLWLRRDADGGIQVVAEPAWHERDRLLDQVLELNDDLIATQRSLSRRQRELERAQEDAAQAARRVHQLEAIMLAAMRPRDFEGALRSLLATAQEILPGDRADILLLDEDGEHLEIRASAGPGAPAVPDQRSLALGAGVLGRVAARDTAAVVRDLAVERRLGPTRDGSMIATPLRLDGQVIGVLAASAADPGCFSESHLSLLEAVGERVALAVGQAQVREHEQRLVQTLQRALLPQRLPEVDGLELAARYRPLATGVGGDFYDAVTLSEGALGIAIGDVTGKGLRAAATMGRLRSALHAYALDTREPSDVLLRLGRLATEDDAFATALYLRIDPATGEMVLASAGHLPPLLITDGQASFLDIGPALSPLLGLTVDRRGQMTLALPPDGTLVLYTDGLVERTHNIDEGMAGLAAACADLAGTPADELCERLVQRLAPAGRYRDDVAVLALRRTA